MNSIKNDRVECYLISKKVNPNSNKKLPYVALLYSEPETGNLKRFFVNKATKMWDRMHKTYKLLFDFNCPIGFIIETRERPGFYSKKKFYKVRKSERNYHLKKISQLKANILAKKISKKLAKQNKNFRQIPPDTRMEVYARDHGRCSNCETRDNIQYDHIIPFSWGGSNSPENLQLLCKRCNLIKSSNLTMPIEKQYAFCERKKKKGIKFNY